MGVRGRIQLRIDQFDQVSDLEERLQGCTLSGKDRPGHAQVGDKDTPGIRAAAQPGLGGYQGYGRGRSNRRLTSRSTVRVYPGRDVDRYDAPTACIHGL